jgi:hypothetical protein
MICLKFIKISGCLLSLIILSSCCCLNDKPVWPQGFPVRAKVIKYDRDPVQSFNKTNKTYTVISEFMENSLNNKLFIDEILIWKSENGIK